MWYFLSAILGVTIGALSYDHGKLFVSFIVAVTPVVGIVVFRVLMPFFMAFRDLPSELERHADSETTVWSAMSEIVLLGQDRAILFFPFFILFGRILGKVYIVGFEKPYVPETRDARKRRYAQEYNFDEF